MIDYENVLIFVPLCFLFYGLIWLFFIPMNRIRKVTTFFNEDIIYIQNVFIYARMKDLEKK